MFKTLKRHLGLKEKSKHLYNDIPQSLQKYEIRETLGTGTFGRVRLIKDSSNGEFFALKICKKRAIIKLKQVEHVKNEISLLRRINHPGVVNLISFFQSDSRIYLVMEFVEGGEMFNHLRNMGSFSENQCVVYSGEIALIFKHIHSLNVAYRDLKPENLLFTREGRIKLADFGFAKVVDKRTWTLCGTPEYLAPEIILSKGHGKGVDWWALGVLIYEMLVGFPPFNDDDPVQIYQKILCGRYEIPSFMSKNAQDIVKNFIQEDRTKRLGCTRGSFESIQNHEWFDSIDWSDLQLQKHIPPFIPRISFNGDTSNFDRYPESIEEKHKNGISSSEQAQFNDLIEF